MNYQEFLESKIKKVMPSGFNVDANEMNPQLFEFQKIGVQRALSYGRFALFEDCGLGKTFQFLEWSRIISEKTNRPVLILSPLAVVAQTVSEGQKFGINIEVLDPSASQFGPHLYITNYDQLKNIDCSQFSGIVLDESSILKGRDGKTSSLIISSFAATPYRLACTATPSPNDHMELGQHSEFLGYMSYHEMLAMFFVHDGGETSKWRLRKHAKDAFWKYVSSWSMSIDNPARIGCQVDGYQLPPIEYHEHRISVPAPHGTDICLVPRTGRRERIHGSQSHRRHGGAQNQNAAHRTHHLSNRCPGSTKPCSMTTNTLKLPPASEAVDIYPYLAVHHPGGGPLDTDNIAPCDVVIVSLSRGMEKEKKVLITPLSFDTWQFFSQKEEEYHPLPKGTQFIIQQ